MFCPLIECNVRHVRHLWHENFALGELRQRLSSPFKKVGRPKPGRYSEKSDSYLCSISGEVKEKFSNSL